MMTILLTLKNSGVQSVGRTMDYRKRYGLIQSDTLGQLYHTAADYQMFIMWKPGGRNDASPYVPSSYEN